MRVDVNGIRMFFDVEGARFVPDGPVMREKPTLLLLHGGPGLDHSAYKPAFSQFTDIAQVVYLDHRGNGRSDRGNPALWNLAQWGDDVKAFCDAIEIEKPIVLGNSFGGFVAMSYAARHPEHPGKLVLSSTRGDDARRERRIELFTEYGGPEIGAMARTWFEQGFDQDLAEAWVQKAMPLYNRRPAAPFLGAVRSNGVFLHFDGPGGEGHHFNLLPGLAAVQCPTLVMGGEDDPVCPIECQEDIAAAFPPHLVRFERFADCGHGPWRDQPQAAFAKLREFILA